MPINFYQGIYERLQKHPDDELIVWPEQLYSGHTYTGRNILDRVSILRNELSIGGVKPGQQVLLVLPVTFDLICSLLAVMALGAIPVLPPAAASLRTLLSLVLKRDTNAVIIPKRIGPPFSWLLKRLGVRLFVAAPTTTSPSAWYPPQLVEPNQPALISHSSGSTGKAKPIQRSHQVLLAQHQALNDSFPPWPGQRDFPLFPNILLHNLAVGTVSILPNLPGFKVASIAPDRILQQVVSQRVQTLTGNVYYFQKLLLYLESHPSTFPQVRALGIGGSPVPELLVHSLKPFFVQADIYIIYGSSEAEPIAIRKIDTDQQNPRLGYAVGSIHPAIQLQLRTSGTLTFPDGTSYEAGEIEVKGGHVATEGKDWLRTGDFGYLDANKQLFLTGRTGNEQVHQGVQHYQIEHVLTFINGVARVAARSTDVGFTIYIEGNPNEEDLWKTLGKNFPKGLVNQIHFREKLPVDARHLSKIRYEQLK